MNYQKGREGVMEWHKAQASALLGGSGGERVVPTSQGCGFDLRSGPR